MQQLKKRSWTAESVADVDDKKEGSSNNWGKGILRFYGLTRLGAFRSIQKKNEQIFQINFPVKF